MTAVEAIVAFFEELDDLVLRSFSAEKSLYGAYPHSTTRVSFQKRYWHAVLVHDHDVIHVYKIGRHVGYTWEELCRLSDPDAFEKIRAYVDAPILMVE